MSIQRDEAVLVLADGFQLRGLHFGATGKVTGEIHVSTALASHHATLTDPQLAGKIVLFTTPHVGATGTNDAEAPEAVQAVGIILREATRRASSWRATGELEPDLAAENIVGICEVDTRALTRHLQSSAPQRAAIFSGDGIPLDPLSALNDATTFGKDA